MRTFRDAYNGIPYTASSIITWYEASGRMLRLQIKATKEQYIDKIIEKLKNHLILAFRSMQPNLSATYFRVTVSTPSPSPTPTPEPTTSTTLDKIWSFIKEHKWISLGAVGILGLGIYWGVRK